MARVTEEDISVAVARIAKSRKDGVCSHRRARTEVPNLVALTPDDRAPSVTRKGEEMWHQLVRNIKSHDAADGNFIERGILESVPRVGYRITPAGLKYLAKRGF